MRQSYSQDDVQQILQRAITLRTEGGEFSRQQLMEMAQEIGIPLTDLEAAEQEWTTLQSAYQEEQDFQRFQQERLASQAIRFGIVNVFLFSLDWVIAPGFTFAQYVFLGWGLKLSLDTWKVFQVDSEQYEKEFERWRQRRQFKRLRREVGQTVVGYLRETFRRN